MKRILAILLLSGSISFAQSNYFALSYSNTIAHLVAKHVFNYATYSDTSNTVAVGTFGGYMYPSNFSGATKWTFPRRIIITTNAVVTFNVLTTNALQGLGGFYRLQLYTNSSLITPYYDSTDTAWIQAALPTYATNLAAITITNHVPAASLTNNITYCTFSIKVGPIGGNWYTYWITGGEISF